ncbi:M23 family metallopeptidase [Thalassotalea insulae]|nr:M23 family metallopeptidase [Thalassotalea insulae]
MKLNKFHWLSALAVFAIISGFVVHLLISSDAKPDTGYPVVNTGSELGVSSAHDINQQQVTALTMKLAELQSQVLRLNALGDRLANEANIPEKEFNFQQLPPSGGPLRLEQVTAKSLTELLADIKTIEAELGIEEKQLKLLESVTLGHHIENTSYLSGRPITKGWLSSYFGIRKDPFTGRPARHKGVDFAGKEDAEIISTAAGVVSWAGERYGYGNLVEINHGKGFKTRYGHNKKLLVKVGDVVSKGQVIARMGSTGRSTGPHVHYEILRNNTQIDPIKYVYRKAK